MSKADLFGRLSKWAIELGQLDIKFLPRATIKGQVLTNFVVEFLPRTMSPEQGCLASAHKGEESLGAKSVGIQSAQGDHEAIKEPPRNAETTITEEITQVLEVN